MQDPDEPDRPAGAEGQPIVLLDRHTCRAGGSLQAAGSAQEYCAITHRTGWATGRPQEAEQRRHTMPKRRAVRPSCASELACGVSTLLGHRVAASSLLCSPSNRASWWVAGCSLSAPSARLAEPHFRFIIARAATLVHQAIWRVAPVQFDQSAYGDPSRRASTDASTPVFSEDENQAAARTSTDDLHSSPSPRRVRRVPRSAVCRLAPDGYRRPGPAMDGAEDKILDVEARGRGIRTGPGARYRGDRGHRPLADACVEDPRRSPT